MGNAVERLAASYGIGRAEQDAFALESQRRAAMAQAAGWLAAEIVPVEVPSRQGVQRVERDEHPRPESSLERLATLRPAFEEAGTVTAGNTSGINDGAAAVVVMSAARAVASGLTPLARIVAWAAVGVAPLLFGIGPVPAIRRVLEGAGLSLAQVDRYEINEAFAAQTLAVQRDLELDPARLNVNGGAIALGHPIGASGARLMLALLGELGRHRLRRGLVSLCIGGGMGIAMLVERPEADG
jgi:acetyl-CoA acetyltransferase family protein